MFRWEFAGTSNGCAKYGAVSRAVLGPICETLTEEARTSEEGEKYTKREEGQL